MEAGDEQLMLAYREGDAGAFEELYRRHKGGLFRFVLRSVRERAVAEELYQEIWMRAIEARGRYKPRRNSRPGSTRSPTTGLSTIGARRGSRSFPLEAESDFPANPGSEPQGILEAKQGLELFTRALEQLPPAQREAFLLHHEAEMSVAEIARATGSNEEAAKSRLRYAMAKLKEALGDG